MSSRTASNVLRTPAEQRRRKVRRIRAAIRVGVYENDLKLAIALDRLLMHLAGGKRRRGRRTASGRVKS